MVFLESYFLRWSAFLSLFHIFGSMLCAGLFPTPFSVPYSVLVVEDERSFQWPLILPLLTTFSLFSFFFSFFSPHYSLAFLTSRIPWSWCCTARLEGYTGSADELVHLLPLKANAVFLFSPLGELNWIFQGFVFHMQGSPALQEWCTCSPLQLVISSLIYVLQSSCLTVLLPN